MSTLKRGGLVALLGLLAVPCALAAPNHPTGEFKQFANCPLSPRTLTTCFRSVSNSGSFTVGKKTVPIEQPVLLEGGFQGSGESVEFFAPQNGNTLSRAPQRVPGGLSGVSAPRWWPKSLQQWFEDEVAQGNTEVRASLELAAPAIDIKLNTEKLIEKQGVALGLPVKFKLENPMLGPHCYIGSNSRPMQIDFTTGRSGSVKGSVEAVLYNKENTLITIPKGRLVNGTFAAPAAKGCGGILSFFIDPLVNSLFGGASPSGESSAILEGKLQAAATSAVRKSEK
jgi:hypothetical protein